MPEIWLPKFEEIKLMEDNINVYIASCTEKGGIYHYKTHNGNLVFVDKTEMDRPMYMVMSKYKMYVLLRETFENKESGVIVYDIDADGKLINPSEVMTTKGEVACHLMVDGNSIYCTNYISGSVIKMPDTLEVHNGHSIHPSRQNAPHPHYVCESPDNQYIFVSDLGMDKIFIYNKDLTLCGATDMPAGHGPRHLACHPDGKTVYCANELLSTVSILEYKLGTLTVKDTVSTLPLDYDGDSTVAAIRYSNGKIYVTNRGHNSITVFNEDMVAEKWIPCGGDEPRDIWVLNDVIICTNQFSNKVCFIRVADGSIIYEVDMEMPLCVCCSSNIIIS